MSTATAWQKTLAQAYLTVQSAYNTASTQMANLTQNPQIQAYNQLAALIAQSTSDMNTSKTSLANFDNGTYAGAAVCFPANKETTYQSPAGLSLQVGSQTFTSYCPEPTSVCARVAATPNALNSAYFRTCKDLFTTQIQANTLNTQMQAILADATTQASVNAMLALKTQIAQNLSDPQRPPGGYHPQQQGHHCGIPANLIRPSATSEYQATCHPPRGIFRSYRRTSPHG